VIGTLIGFGFRYLMKFCERKELIDRQSYVAQYVSLALLTIGVCTLLGSDDLLAAFCCGTAFAWDGFFNRQTEEAVFSSVIDLLFNIASFVFVGAWMPFGLFNSEELSLAPWRLIVLALLVLLLRRLPIMIALYKFIPDIKTFREAVFSGHFGPIGIGGVFISTLAAERLPHPHHPPKGQAEMLAATIQPVVAFMVLCSVLVHGLSIPSFSLGRRVHSVRREWSRRSTTEVGGGPEWAAQIRRLRPGEKPEVNRDVERDGATEANGSPVDTISGDISAAAKREEDKELTGPERAKAHEREAAPVEDVNNPDTKEKEPTQPPPDGDEILSEWREGSDRIIERRAGPGEEVRRCFRFR
jgi:NhaP-type Na+/H+ or K+/H+ antiporter